MSTTASMLKSFEYASSACAENQIYRALIAVSSPEQPLELAVFDGIGWDELLRRARYHSLSPLLAHRLLESSVEMPLELRARLKQEFQSNLRRNFALLDETTRIASVLREEGIDAIPYKGPILAEQLWGSFALRECSDIDLLVRRADVDRAAQILSSLGYCAVSAVSQSLRRKFVRNASEEQFRHAESDIFLELQWAPAPRAMAVDFDEESLWRNRSTTKIAGAEVNSPGPKDLFSLLAIHGWKHNWSKLIWVADVAQLIHRNNIDWDSVQRSAGRGGWRGILTLALATVERVYGLPETISFDRDPRVVQLTERLESGLRAAKAHSYLEWHRDMLTARDNRMSQFRPLTSFFLTPGLADYEYVKLPGWASATYRFIRIARLLRFGPSKTVA